MMREAKGNKDWSGKLLLVATLLLALNSAYLAGFATPGFFYVGNSLLHPALGIITAVLLLIYAARHFNEFRRNLGAALLVLSAVAGGFGIYLAVVGMTSRHRLALDIHVASAIAALAVALAYLRSRLGKARKAGGVETVLLPRRAWLWSVGVMAAAVALCGGGMCVHHFFPAPQYIIRNPAVPPMSMAQEGGGAHSLVWPSSAQTANEKSLPESYFMNSKSCEPCHSDIYHEWESSMHHYASFNNQWYRKTIEYMQDTIGIKPSLWCGGCHDQALSLTGYMEKYPIRKIEETPAGQNGLGCVSCHGLVHVGSTMGQGDYVFKYPELANYAESSNPLMHDLAYYEVQLNPKAHESVFFKPFHHQDAQVAKFCSACHKVHMDVPVNHYRWNRGFDEYDNWQASGTDWQGARSFYYPPKPETCVDCHMPLVRSNDFGNINGFIHSHRFAAANTAIPTAYGDTSQIAAVDKFLKGALSVDIFALAEEPSASTLGPGTSQRINPLANAPALATTFAQGEESARGGIAAVTTVSQPARIIAPLGRVKATLYRGETVRVEVVVRTLKLGHFFPGGTVDAYDCWLELQARDNKGHIIFWSGEAADHGNGPVDPTAHFYHSLQLDEHGNVINKRDTWLTRAVVYTHLIPPGAADTVHYKLLIPKNCGNEITITAKLNYRKFSWWYTQWAFAGVRDPGDPHYGLTYNFDDGRWTFKGNLANVSAKDKRIPDVPTVVIAQQTRTLPVEGNGAEAPSFAQQIDLNKEDMLRWNDYGIGLLLQGDLKGAERAFRTVTEVDPTYANGWVNVARAMIQEGNTDAAKPLLERALKLDPRLGSAHYFYGLALKADGEYPQAYDQFAMAAARYPKDRVVRNQMGRLLFLQRKYRLALKQYQQTIGVDPEDLEAHYNMMLCYMGLGDSALAAREQHLYLRFKANEAAKSITGPYLLTHPGANNEAQAVHEHITVPLDEIAHPPASWYTPYPVTQTAPAAGARVAASFRPAHAGAAGGY